MTALFNRWLPGVTLLAWGAVLLTFYVSGRIASLLIPAFRINVLIAGLVFLAMAACFLLLPGVANCCDDERCGHPLGRWKFGRLLTFLILLLPVVTAAMFAPKNYSASAIERKVPIIDASALAQRSGPRRMAGPQAAPQAVNSSDASEPPLPTKSGAQPAQAAAAAAATPDAADQYLPKSKDGNIQVQVIDLLYAAQDTSMRADFDGKTVETIGQLMPDDTHNGTGTRFKLMRMFMYCCAADAKPIASLVEYPNAAPAPEMSWVKVVGKVSFPIEGGRPIPILKATSVKQVDPPEETMLY